MFAVCSCWLPFLFFFFFALAGDPSTWPWRRPRAPGELQELIVQPRGYPPFRMPRKSFDGKGRDEEVGWVMPAHVVKRMDLWRVERGGREIQVIEIEAEDAGGRPLKAQVSEEVAPIGVCRAENDGIRMELAVWGTGAKTRIDGAPRSFYLWIFEQIGRGL